jgi:hypothetical protein
MPRWLDDLEDLMALHQYLHFALGRIFDVFKKMLAEALPPLSILDGHRAQGVRLYSNASVAS